MTRLSIIDLAGGRQPIWLDDEKGHVVINDLVILRTLSTQHKCMAKQ